MNRNECPAEDDLPGLPAAGLFRPVCVKAERRSIILFLIGCSCLYVQNGNDMLLFLLPWPAIRVVFGLSCNRDQHQLGGGYLLLLAVFSRCCRNLFRHSFFLSRHGMLRPEFLKSSVRSHEKKKKSQQAVLICDCEMVHELKLITSFGISPFQKNKIGLFDLLHPKHRWCIFPVYHLDTLQTPNNAVIAAINVDDKSGFLGISQ